MIEKIKTYDGRLRNVKYGETQVRTGWAWRCTKCEEIFTKEPTNHKCGSTRPSGDEEVH
jgi:rRNA maturation endonuclease Nob1